MAVANTVAYYDTATITAVKSFIAQTPEKTSTCQLKTFFVFLFFGNIFFFEKKTFESQTVPNICKLLGAFTNPFGIGYLVGLSLEYIYTLA
jgi:hypothetical protein